MSHSSSNAEQAHVVAAALEASGHVVFLDQDEHHGIVPGEPWQDRLFDELKRCRALIYLNSARALASDWCRLEVAMALQQDKPVVTLDLEPDLERHPLLGSDQAILFRGSLDEGVTRLIDALERLGIAPSPGGRWDPDRSPYPGLRSFDAADAGMYFGREEDIRDVIGLLEASAEGDGVVTVVGASGVGKSSLLRAGVTPRLAAGGAPWVTVDPFEPQAHPADRLLGCIGALRSQYPVDVPTTGDPVKDLPRLADALALAAAGPQGRLLITVDSLEQLLTVSTPDQRDLFLDLVRSVAREGVSVSLLLAIRLDQSEALQRLSPLGDLMRQPLFIAPLSRDRLDDIIERPAIEAGLSLEDGLADRIADDAGSDRDKDGVLSLPLVAFTLQRMWERMRADGRRQIQLADYEAVGRIDGAIAQAATKAEAGSSAQDQGQLDRLLTRFVTVSEQQSMVGRPVPLELLSPEERLIASRLENERLLSGDGDQVQLTHDRLLSAWPRLAKLIAERREDLLVRSRLERQAAEWRRSPSEVLSQPRAAQAEVWLTDHREEATPDVVALVAASTRHWRRKRTNRLIAASAAAILVLLIGVLAVVSRRQAQQADAADRTRRADLLAGRSVAELQRDPVVAGWLALESVGVEPTARGRVALARAADGLSRPVPPDDDPDAGAPLTGVAASADGLVAASGEDGAIHRWTAEGDELDPIRAADGLTLGAVAVSGDSATVAAADQDGSITLWDATTDGREGAVLDAGPSEVRALAFAPDGSALAATNTDGHLLVWPMQDGRVSGDPAKPGGPAVSIDAGDAVAFTPDGRQVAVGLSNGSLSVYDIGSWDEPRTVGAHELEVTTIDISPEGIVASGSEDGTVRVRRLDDLGSQLTIRTGLRVASVDVVEDGKVVAAALLDGSVRMWDATTGAAAPRPLRGHRGQATGVASDGGRLYSVGADGRLLRWPLEARVLPSAPKGTRTDDPRDPIAFDGGDWIATAEGSADVGLRRSDDRSLVLSLTPPVPPVDFIEDLAFVDDGHVLLAAAGRDGLWSWDLPSDPQGTDRVAGRVALAGSVDALAASPGGEHLATASGSGRVQLRDPETFEARAPLLEGEEDGGREVSDLAFSDDGSVLAAAGTDGSLRVWDTSSGDQRDIEASDGLLLSVAVSPDGDRVATGSLGESLIRIWDRRTGTEAQPALTTSGPVTDLAFAAGGRTVVATEASGAVAAYDLATGGAGQVPSDAHVGEALALAVDTSAAQILTVGRDGIVAATPCPICWSDTALEQQVRDALASERKLTPAERVLYGLGPG